MKTQMKLLLLATIILQLSFSSSTSSQTTINLLGLVSPDSQSAFSITQSDDSKLILYSIGDINGDGINDLIIASNLQVYVLYGGADHFRDFVVPSWDDYTSIKGFRIYLDRSTDLVQISSFGDFNNDGINDMILQVRPQRDGTQIEAIMIYGKRDRDYNDLILESNLALTDGFRIFTTKRNDYFFKDYSVIRTGDINNDGMDDAIIRTHQQQSGNETYQSGILYILYGNARISDDINLDNLSSDSMFHIYDTDLNVMLSIERIGDINNDGVHDFATKSSINNYIYVFYGKGGKGLSAKELTSWQGFGIKGNDPYYRPNYYSRHAGDLNGDGMTDLVIGVEQNSIFRPVYIIYGKTSGFYEVVLENLTPSDGFKIVESAGTETLGTFSTHIGDINNDGFDDLLIISMGYPKIRSEKKGYVIFGQKDRRPDIDVTFAENLLTFKANVTNDDFFEPLKTGDLNGDGIDDIAFKTISKVSGLYGSNCEEYIDCSSPMPTICYASKGCACRKKNMIMQDLLCVSGCSPGYYEASDSICKICPVGCKECSSYSSCEACIDDHLLQGSSCVRFCSDGYFRQGSSCVRTCFDGYLHQYPFCVSSCSQEFLVQDSVCVWRCSDDYFRQGSSCVRACFDGYLRQDSLCVRSCANTYLLQDSLCVRSCSNGYLKIGSICQPNKVIFGATAGAVTALVIVIISIVYIRRRKKHAAGNNNTISFPAVRFESEIEMRMSTTPSHLGKDSYLEQPIERVQDNNDPHPADAVIEEENENNNEEEGVNIKDQHQVEYEDQAKRAW